MTRHTIVLNIAILLLGVSSVHMHGMSELIKEDFIKQLHEACTNNNNIHVEGLLKKLDIYDYEDEVKSNNNALHIICNTLNDNPQDDCKRQNAKKILVHLLHNNFNPNIQDENNNTPLHILKPLSTNIKILRSLRNYGANLYMKNSDNKDPYYLALENKPEQNYFATIDRAYTRWKDLCGHTGWQEDRGYRQESIRKRYRYLFADTHQEEPQNSDGRIVFVIVRNTGTSGESGCHKDYYDPTSLIFQSFMNYAKAYVEHYNSTKEQQQEFKILHLISFLWNGNLLNTISRVGQKLAEYLDSWHYRNSKIILIAQECSCDVASFASHQLHNTGKKNNDGLYEGRIEEMIFFAPHRRPKILDAVEKDSIINSLGIIDACNNIMPIKPTNYDQLFVFYSPTVGGYLAYETLKKFKQYHTHNGKFPINRLDQVEGPKIDIKTMVDGNYIGHNNPKLLENFATVLKILKTQYTLNVARCNAFKVNIVTDKTVEEKLLQFIESENNKTLFDESENSYNNDQYKELLTFWENRKDNCKVQCMPVNRKGLDEDFFKACNNSKYSMATIQKLKIIKGNKLDSQDFVDIIESIGKKHQHVYAHYDKSVLQKNNNNIPSDHEMYYNPQL